MIKVENVEVWGWEHAIRGMRNPMNSWDKSDSRYCDGYCNPDVCYGCIYYRDGGECVHPADYNEDIAGYIIGPNDLSLMQKLYRGGPEHRKYLRQIFVSLDITAPLYWWKEFDTYKVGTVANSCSTMHKIQVKEFTQDDFSHEHLAENSLLILDGVIDQLNAARSIFNENHDKDEWWQMIQLLPSSYNQRRTVTLTYENVFAIIRQRTGHKLDEWNCLCGILKGFPYAKEIGGLV